MRLKTRRLGIDSRPNLSGPCIIISIISKPCCPYFILNHLSHSIGYATGHVRSNTRIIAAFQEAASMVPCLELAIQALSTYPP